ncbi:hypothetical protein ACS0TY_006416 [Phlomoides rotata]
MGRPLPSNHMQTTGVLAAAPGVMYIVSAAIVFCVFTAVVFLCGSHHVKSGRGKQVVRLGGENKKPRVMEKLKSSLSSSKALLMSKMKISWRKVQDEEEEEDNVVWKKTIIKGDKCRPLDFSGKILYDSDGNLLSD